MSASLDGKFRRSLESLVHKFRAHADLFPEFRSVLLTAPTWEGIALANIAGMNAFDGTESHREVLTRQQR